RIGNQTEDRAEAALLMVDVDAEPRDALGQIERIAEVDLQVAIERLDLIRPQDADDGGLALRRSERRKLVAQGTKRSVDPQSGTPFRGQVHVRSTTRHGQVHQFGNIHGGGCRSTRESLFYQ